jgi:hypothetical protein
MNALHTWLYFDLDDAENLPNVINNTIHWTFIAPGPTQRDGCAELVTSLVVAAVNAKHGYEVLYTGAEGLRLHASHENLFGELPFRLTEACLLRFPDGTNSLLLGRLQRGLIDIYFIFKYLNNNRSVRPEYLMLFFYFGPGLLAFRPVWYQQEWDSIHTKPVKGNLK